MYVLCAFPAHSSAEAEILNEVQTKQSLQSFPPCNAESPLQLCLAIFISSNSRNLVHFLQCVTACTVYTVKEKGWKLYPLPNGLINSYRNLKSGELSRLWPETSKKNLYIQEFGFRLNTPTCERSVWWCFLTFRKTLRELYDENIRVLADFVGSDPKNLGIFVNHTVSY